jgi:hypothetical protein
MIAEFSSFLTVILCFPLYTAAAPARRHCLFAARTLSGRNILTAGSHLLQTDSVLFLRARLTGKTVLWHGL